MTQRDILLLQDSLDRLGSAERWLQRSYRMCRAIDLAEELDEEECDALETLTRRFARVSDMVEALLGGGRSRGVIDSSNPWRSEGVDCILPVTGGVS